MHFVLLVMLMPLAVAVSFRPIDDQDDTDGDFTSRKGNVGDFVPLNNNNGDFAGPDGQSDTTAKDTGFASLDEAMGDLAKAFARPEDEEDIFKDVQEGLGAVRLNAETGALDNILVEVPDSLGPEMCPMLLQSLEVNDISY